MAEVGLTHDEGVKELESQIESFKDMINQIRTGVANLDMVREINVPAYGAEQKLEHVATLNIVSAQTISVKPFDPGLSQQIGETLQSARPDYSIGVKQDEIMVNIPPLTEESRQEYIRMLKDKTENYRQKIRDIRHRMRDNVNEEKDNLPEDDYYRALEQIDKTVSSFNEKLENLYQKKSDEILQV